MRRPQGKIIRESVRERVRRWLAALDQATGASRTWRNWCAYFGRAYRTWQESVYGEFFDYIWYDQRLVLWLIVAGVFVIAVTG